MSELSNFLDFRGGTGKPTENGTDISTLLHGDDSELVLLVHPSKESLLIVVEDTATLGPVTVEATSFQETVTLLEKEVIVDKLLLLGWGHRLKGVVGSFKITSEFAESRGNESLNLTALLSRDAGSKREGSEVATDSDAGAADHSRILWREGRAAQLFVIHVADVTIVDANFVVVLDDGSEQVGKGLIRVGAGSVDTDAGVGVLAS